MSASRLNEPESRYSEHWLLWAFAISLVAHLFFYGAFVLASHLGLLAKDALRTWLTHAKPPVALVQKPPVKPPLQEQQEIPLNFIEVDPSAAIPEPPKNAKYYSSKNSQAANQEADRDSTIPKIDGQQTHVARTQTAPRSKPAPLQPAPAQPSPAEAQKAKAKPKGGPKIGDLAMAKPDAHPENNSTENDTGETQAATHSRPRTLIEARSQHAMAGEKMKQEGGVKHRLMIDSMDAKATPFGEYDRELIEAIQYRWDALLDEKRYAHDATGKVVVYFTLDYKGRISDMKIEESSVDQLMSTVCQLAISQPAPYAPWPTDMRHFLNKDFREIRFTFYYN